MPATKVSFRTQLETFRELGFTPQPDTDIADMDGWGGEEKFEEDPYVLLYFVLGSHTDRCWHFDAECIEDHGAYADIIENISRITRGEMKFEDIEDYVMIDDEVAWVSFTINGDKYKWNMQVEDDWVDPTIFTRIVELTRKYDTKARFTYYPGGQDCVIGYETPEHLALINQKTGLEIEWLR